MRAAKFYKKSGANVKCQLCRHFCLIAPAKFGLCGMRKNIDGRLYSLNYGKIIASQIDPIEKKPLYHFLPGSFAYSLACPGCNFKCLNCQNSDLSQITPALQKAVDSLPETRPEEIVEAAWENNCPSIAYTYTEPTIFAEFALDCMELARDSNLKNIWVSNGYLSPGCLEAISPYLDAINIDLKFFSDKNYQKICGARLKPVLDNLVAFKTAKIHLEITTLIIPSLNDSDEELTALAEFIYQKLGDDTPWHLGAFHPAYKLKNLPATPTETIKRAQAIGKNIGLKYVYPGNV
ncbi:MAG: AmmeMemoRadiSam system radical SAM enzyme [Patescibacteria group bacterium]